jgi:Flp pilus assembly protein TadD
VTHNNNEALSWFQRAVDLEPNNPNYIFDLGTAYFFMGNQAKADELHQKAIQIDPKLQEKLSQGKR